MARKEKVKDTDIILEKKDKNVAAQGNVTLTIILGLIGLILLLLSDALNRMIGYVVGFGLLALGLIAIYKHMNKKDENTINFIVGILYSVLGVIIIIYPHSVINLVAKCLGVYLVISAITKIQLALSLRNDSSVWIGTFSVGILILAFGALLIFNPFSGVAITKLAGGFLTAFAVFDLIDNFIIRKNR